MSCLDFRRAALIDPYGAGAKWARHLSGCFACRRSHLEALDAERRLRRVLRIPVPDGLSVRLQQRIGALRWRRWYAIAAALVVAVAILCLLAVPRNDTLALAGIEFVVFDEALAIAEALPADREGLARASRELNVSLPRELGDARYIGPCPFAGTTAHHVLLKTPHGKATVLLVPGRAQPTRTAAAAHGLVAAIAPAGKGLVAIIGSSKRSVARIEALLRSTGRVG